MIRTPRISGNVRSTLKTKVDHDELQFTLVDKISLRLKSRILSTRRNASHQDTEQMKGIFCVYSGGILQETCCQIWLKRCFLKIYFTDDDMDMLSTYYLLLYVIYQPRWQYTKTYMYYCFHWRCTAPLEGEDVALIRSSLQCCRRRTTFFTRARRW
jgi:hypothetical protein